MLLLCCNERRRKTNKQTNKPKNTTKLKYNYAQSMDTLSFLVTEKNIFLCSFVFKVFNAASHGASGAIIYTDPGQFAPDGPLNTFPNSWWLPDTGVQRGTSLGKQGPGDPLTPGFPSVDGIYRKPLNQSGLPTIPAMALSYGDAKEILRRMKGKFHTLLYVSIRDFYSATRLTVAIQQTFTFDNYV